mgnify:FL=1
MKKKILLIDDQEDLIELTRRILQSHGYEVVGLTDGEGALEIIKGESPHLVILDMIMPGKDGTEICQEMKSDATTRHIPVILSTGQMLEPGDFSREGLKEADGYLMKPFEIDELLSKIQSLLPL